MLPRHISKKHPPMAASNRAAQFLPFAALTGYDAAIQEAARRTDSFIELDESRKSQLDMQLRLIRENLDAQPEIEATYFQPDEKKNGGAYVTAWVKKCSTSLHGLCISSCFLTCLNSSPEFLW